MFEGRPDISMIARPSGIAWIAERTGFVHVYLSGCCTMQSASLRLF
jgi:hypothetical protein